MNKIGFSCILIIVFYFFYIKANSQTNLVLNAGVEDDTNDKPTVQKFRTSVGLSPAFPLIKDVSSSASDKGKPGFGINIKQEFNFHKNIGVVIGLEYLNWGIEFDAAYVEDYKYNCSECYDRFKHKLRINEIQIPVLIKLNTNPIGNKTFYCFGGLALRYPIKTNAKISSNQDGQLVWGGNTKIEVNGLQKSLIIGGIGSEIELSENKHKLYLEFKYISEACGYCSYDYYGNGSNDLAISNSYVMVTLGYFLIH